MIDLTKNPSGKYNGKEAEYVLEALNSESKDPRKGKWVQTFESEFCKTFGVKYAIACNSGTSGLHAALVAAGVQPGDEVISPALTVIMDAFATIFTGATPVFADVNSKTHNIDPEDVRSKITPKTKAIIVVSLQGLSTDIDPIMEIAKKNNIIVIEDSAQTLMGKNKGRIAGTIGHIGVFSFESKKHITTGGEGGMIVSNDEILAEKARKFAGIGYKHLTAIAGRTSLAIDAVQDPCYERFGTLGLNYRMTEMSAAIGLAQLERIKFIISRRQKVAEFFSEAIAGCSWMEPQMTPENYEHSYYTFSVFYHGDEAVNLPWKEFYKKYKEKGGDGFYGACKVPYLEPVFRNLSINGRTYQKGLCQNAERIQPTIMQFKTNYRDLDVAKKKADILAKLIRKIGK